MLDIKVGDKIEFYSYSNDTLILRTIKKIDWNIQTCYYIYKGIKYSIKFDNITKNLTTFKVYKDIQPISKLVDKYFYVMYDSKPYTLAIDGYQYDDKGNRVSIKWTLSYIFDWDFTDIFVDEWQLIPIKNKKKFADDLWNYIEQQSKLLNITGLQYRNQYIYDNPDFVLPKHLHKYI